MTDLEYVVPTVARPISASDLESLRADLEDQRRFRVEQLGELAVNASRGSRSAELEEVASALRTAAESALVEIDAALYRIELGCYGVCQRCRDSIPRDRLEVLPMASLCMPCQYATEMTGNSPSRQAVGRAQHRRGAAQRSTGRSGPPSGDRASVRSDIVEEWGLGSFAAGDPPANW